MGSYRTGVDVKGSGASRAEGLGWWVQDVVFRVIRYVDMRVASGLHCLSDCA